MTPIFVVESAVCGAGEIRANVRRIRCQVMSAAPLDFKAEGHKLAELIKQYSIS